MTRRMWPWLRMFLAVAILGVLVWRLGTGAFVDGLRLVDGPAVAAALGIGLLTTVLSVWRWSLVANRLGLPLPLPAAVADYYRALFLNAVLPAGVLGDAHRAVRHGRQVGDVGRGVRAVVLERAGGQIVLIAAGMTVLLAEPALAAAVARDILPGLGVTAAVLGGLAAAGVLLVRGRWGSAVARLRRAAATSLADARLGLFARDAWPGVLALSAATLLGHLSLFLVAARTAGSSAPAGQLLPLMLLALLVMGLPVNVGGWGPREAFSAVAFGALGLGARQGLTAAVVYGVLTFVSSLPGALVLLSRLGSRSTRPATGAAPVRAPETAPVRTPETVPGRRTEDGRTLWPGAEAEPVFTLDVEPAFALGAAPGRSLGTRGEGRRPFGSAEDGEMVAERRDQAVEHALPLSRRGQ
ncbi:lysylphosphatidylglycerol synthase transmembrane domain-containing protein [Sphaerisporangium corydalis]|uniref:Lysylphosphatidylglycerol synthase transmembrane domain-containing protein n=1 Tax=Sphaerisporangium corydalis TaxID=1441875 RepID=A0ABV9ECS6_9ACTN|nr:lysylphosphatidylglycerol synthase transmembrane domain-containing protein [Sphaerisporangium corydalis]